jgi:hypothetical protein
MSAKLVAQVGLSLVVAFGVFTAPVGAAPPSGGGGGGSTPAGTIYYLDSGVPPANHTWSMNFDGSAKTEIGMTGVYLCPSGMPHAGVRWYLTVLNVSGTYADGTPRREVFAVKSDGTRVQLTDSPEMQAISGTFLGMDWLLADQRISFKARRWNGGAPVDAGLYTADLAFGADGSIVGLSTQPVAVAAFPLSSDGLPTLISHSWDPTGTKAVYTDSSTPGIWIVDAATGAKTQISTLAAAYPHWSPVANAIVMGCGGSIYTINQDGTSLKAILRPKIVGGTQWSWAHPCWSADGHYVVLGGYPTSGGWYDVFRMTAGGGSVTNLTNTASIGEVPLDWGRN